MCRTIQKDVAAASRLAQDNLRFLEVLRGPCQAIREAKPEEIPGVCTKLLMAVRIVATHSEYYTTPERICGNCYNKYYLKKPISMLS